MQSEFDRDLQPTSEINPFKHWVLEQLAGQEIEDNETGVLAIGGHKWSGATTIAGNFARLIEEKTGVKPPHFSFEDDYRNVEDTAGSVIGLQTKAGIFRETGRIMAQRMLLPENRGKFVIIEGGHTPFVTRAVELAGQELVAEGAINSFPARVVTVFVYADRDTRYTRRYPGTTPESREARMMAVAQNELERKEAEDRKAFQEAYNRTDNPFNFNFSFNGSKLYDLFYDVKDGTASETAIKIFNSPEFKHNLLPIVDSQTA